MVKCPECGDKYKRIGMHWNGSPSHRPKLTQKQIEITTGVLMGDGWINKNGKNKRLMVEMISPNYLEYLDNVFGCLSTGVSLEQTAAESVKMNKKNGFRPNAKEENYSDIFIWRTRSHPKFNQFREWYESGKKVWPEDIELTPTVLKHWYVGDGCYEKDGRRISIGISNEIENTEKISKYFTDLGLPEPSNYDIRENNYSGYGIVYWTVEDSPKLWDYMGEPLPDFEYKWPEEYR